jgi:hypothetical protein
VGGVIVGYLFKTRYEVLESDIDKPAVSESVTITLYLYELPEEAKSNVFVV